MRCFTSGKALEYPSNLFPNRHDTRFFTTSWSRAAMGLAVMVAGLTLFAGCAPHAAVKVAPIALRTSTSPATAPVQTMLAHVHTLPLYQEAEQACKVQHFSAAAGLLQRLGRRQGLTAAEITFVQQQRAICLQDAGLPVHVQPRSPQITRHSTTEPAPISAPAQAFRNAPADADCGPRALLLLCSRLGVKTTLPFLRQKAGTTTAGTSMAGLETAAQAVGLKAEGVQVSREALHEVETPALAYVNGNHFLEIVALSGKGENATATIHDPNAAGEKTISQERLLRLCSGYLLLVKR